MLQRLRELLAPATHRVVWSGPAADATRGPVEQALRHLLAELPDLLLAAVAEADTGQPLAAYTTQPHWRPAAVTGPCAAALRQLPAAGSAAGAVEEVLLTLGPQVHVLRPAPGGRLLYLAVDGRDTNLALAREVMRGTIERLTPSPAAPAPAAAPRQAE